MAKKKKAKAAPVPDTQPVEAVAKSRKTSKQTTLQQQARPMLFVMVASLVLLLGAAFFYAGHAGKAQREELVDLYEHHYVVVVNQYLRTHSEMVDSRPDAELLPFLQEVGGPDKGLLKIFPGAVFARVVPLNLDPSVPNGLSFAQQDMALRMVAAKKVYPEISFYEGGAVKEQVVTFGRMLRGGDGARAGILLLSFPVRPLEASLKDFGADAGQLELVQTVGDDKATILRTGQGEVSAAVTAATENPGWELRFAPARTLAESVGRSGGLLAFFVLVPLLAGGLFVLGIRALQKKVEEDIAAIDTFSENFFHYGTRQRPSLHFDFSGILLSHLDQYGAELRAGRGVTKPIPTDDLGDLNMDMDNDAAFLLGDAPAPKVARPSAPVAPAVKSALPGLQPEIFRAYDIRGVVGQGLSPEVARALGQAIGSEALARGESTVVVGRDGRLSGPELSAALIEGLRASGRDVIDVGVVPTPVLYFAAKTIGSGSGVMVTGSHNPANYNGFKIMLAGDTLAGDEIQALRQRIEKSDFSSGSGNLSEIGVGQDYVDRVTGDIALARPLRVVVDGGNGVAGPIAVRTLEALGCEVVPLFCEIDGSFPNHHPDPSKLENLEDLMGVVAANNADLGLAFDGDGDRIGVVTAGGKAIFPDRLMMLYAKHVLTTNPGADIIFDVKCTRDLPSLITRLGGRPVMCKTGHSFIKGKLKETGAALAGEMSGHIFFNDRWFGFDDAIYSAARLLEILSLENDSSDQVFEEFPENASTPEINIPVPDETKFGLMEALKANARFPDANIITIDGVRVEFPEGWGLVRASNTTPCLVARFEGKTPEALADVQAKFKALLSGVDGTLQIPF